jgi:hypothetical protein
MDLGLRDGSKQDTIRVQIRQDRLMKNGFLLVFGILAAVLAGCGKPQMMQAQPVCLEAISQDKLMQVVEKTLFSMQFQIEKYDLESGVIRTRPLRGKQFFELWRSDNAGGFNTAEANVQSIQRTVELTFQPQQTGVCMQCVVLTRRLSLPEEPIQSYYSTPALYTASSPSKQQLEVDETRLETMRWIELGRDESLEQKILKKIQQKIEKGGLQ